MVLNNEGKLIVIKRDSTFQEYDGSKIVLAISKAMAEGKKGVNKDIAHEIEVEIHDFLVGIDGNATIEEISDVIEDKLMEHGKFNTAKRFIKHRIKRDNERKFDINYKFLSKEFISKYKHIEPPMTELGKLVYYRTYSRWLDNQKRREYWWETVARAVDYNCSLVKTTTKAEAEELFDNIFNLRQFLSGRTFWVGGTDVAKNYPMANYNCSFAVIDSFDIYKDIFYLLMIGSGVGVRVLLDDVAKLPKIRTNVDVIHKDYSPMPKNEREDSTSLEFIYNTTLKITVGDSKEGWVQALDFMLKALYSNEYRNIKTLIIDYDHIRPLGAKLKTFGGTASGHDALKDMMKKSLKVISKRGIMNGTTFTNLRPIDCLDIANIIGEGVVVGGVRRTAEIVLIDADDQECIEAKSQLYTQKDGQWVINKDIIHRQMSNNSIYYTEKPTRERLHWQVEKMRYSGEPAWVNAEYGEKRRPNFNGVNPCGEILLDSKGLCNLTTINTYSFVKEDKTLDLDGLLNAQRISARAGYRMTCVTLELPYWDMIQQRDKLIGCSLTGWQDMVNATDMTIEEQKEVLVKLRTVANDEAKNYAKSLDMVEPLLVTTVKPEGTLSQLPTVSSGVHYSHSPYYIRRVRINAHDPLVKVCEELEYPIFPEVGQEMETCRTKVIEFPVKAPDGRTKYDVSAIEQLENYIMFQEFYTDHNTSITVHVRDEEWEIVEQFVWNNWDEIQAVSFLSLSDSFYELLPYEAITEEEYNLKISEMNIFDYKLIQKYEKEEVEIDMGSEGCDSGACPVR